jgi:hypothetical protein
MRVLVNVAHRTLEGCSVNTCFKIPVIIANARRRKGPPRKLGCGFYYFFGCRLGVGGGYLVESTGYFIQYPFYIIHDGAGACSGMLQLKLGPGKSTRGQMALRIFTQRKSGLWDPLGHETALVEK